MWIIDNAGYIYVVLLLAVLSVGWMSIFYIRMNIVKRDESENSLIESPAVPGSTLKSFTRRISTSKMDESVATKKRKL